MSLLQIYKFTDQYKRSNYITDSKPAVKGKYQQLQKLKSTFSGKRNHMSN